MPFEYEDEDSLPNATAWGGLPVLAEAMEKWGVNAALRECVKFGGRRKFTSEDIVRALVLMMAAGGECVDDVEQLRKDLALAAMLGKELPAAETVRQALDLFHDARLVEEAQKKADSKSFVPEESELLRGLQAAVSATVREAMKKFPKTVATLDIDATIQESHKREAKPHYQNGLGYQPVVAYWAELDVVVSDEFRDGNVPAHFDALGVAKRAFSALPQGVEQRRLRADTQMYNVNALQWLVQENIEFAVGVIKRNGFNEACKQLPERDWLFIERRKDTEIAVCDLPFVPERMNGVAGLRYIGIRVKPVQEELLEETRGERYFGVVTNSAADCVELVRWYWGKAGTIERVHDVMKNDLGGGVLPSGRFGANAAWYRICALTYNLLSILRRLGDPSLHDARPKRLRLRMLAIPVVLARHARKLVARVAEWMRGDVGLKPLRHAL